MEFSQQDVEYFVADADEDGRDESLMLIFPDQTLLCVSDNDGDGVADYAAVDIHLTKVVDFAVCRFGDVIEVQRSHGDDARSSEEFDDMEFFETFPGWYRLMSLKFPGGVPTQATLDDTLTTVNYLLLPDWTRRKMPWQEGGLYHIPVDDGSKYGVVKILKVDGVGVHIRQYSNEFGEPPEHVDESQLFLAPFDNDSGHRVGMGHLPISARTFRGWSPRFIQQSTVRPDELVGYEGWREAEGGYF